jgi:hypothetical protein
MWDTDKFERQLDFMVKHKEIGLLSSNLRVFGSSEQKGKRQCIKRSGLIYPAADDIYRENPFLSSSIIMRRFAVEDAGGFMEGTFSEI